MIRPRALLLAVFIATIMVASALALPALNANAEEDEGALRIAVPRDSPSYNIFSLASNSIYKTQMYQWPFEGLAAMDYNNQPYPLLAESWTFDQSSLTVDIDLRQGVKFSDGHEMTADDVVFTYYALSNRTVYTTPLVHAFDQNWDGMLTDAEMQSAIWLTGQYTLAMRMANPYGQFFSSVLTVPIIPQHIWQYHLESDGAVDVLWEDPEALTGTGPFKYGGGVTDQYRVMVRNDLYWGKEFTTPCGYSKYPPNVESMRFEIAGTMDNALRMLRTGEVDYLASAIPSDRLTMIGSAHDISIDYLPDPGYFYLAFNEKVEPFGSLAFRKAVAHLVDKEHIVDAYLEGLGIEGSAAVPPYFNGWHNDAVTEYAYDDPTDPTTTTPEDILDAAGYVDCDGDGWRDLPDGRHLDKLTIFAPPADYDPVRASAAEALATNLVAVGVDAEALSVEFTTLVGKMTSFEYEMLILGWRFSGYTEGVSILFDIYGPLAASNAWGFWSDDYPNPYYSSIGDVSTLADQETQDLVNQFRGLELMARSSFTTTEQMDIVREGQEIIAQAVPCDILYHRVNPEAYRDTWAGWVPYMGTLWNMFSLSELQGGDRPGYEDASNGVNVGMSAQSTAATFQNVYGNVLVIDDEGDPVPDASVSMSFESLAGYAMVHIISPASGTTDAQGVFNFMFNCETPGHGQLKATVSDGIETDEDSMIVQISTELPRTLAVSADVTPRVATVGEPATISIMVTDETGMPVEGVEVAADTALLCPGFVTPDAVLTDAAGHATMTYMAISLLDQAGHDLDRIRLTVSKDGYAYDGSASIDMLVYNGAPPAWTLVKVSAVSTTALSILSTETTIELAVVDDEGQPVPGATLGVGYSDEALVDSPVTGLVADSNGAATFVVTAAANAPTGALQVTVTDEGAASTVPATITLTHVGVEAPSEEMYGGYVTFSEAAQFMPCMDELHATVHVFDSNGAAFDGKAALVLPSPMAGTMVASEMTVWNSLWDYTGIEIGTAADGVDILASGPLNVPMDAPEWVPMEGVDVVAGEMAMTLRGEGVSMTDVLGSIVVVPDGYGYYSFETWNYIVEGQTSIFGGYAYGRSYEVVAASHAISEPVMTASNGSTEYDTSPVAITVVDQEGEPVYSCPVLVHQTSGVNIDYGVLEYTYDYWTPDPVYTAPDGTTVVTLLAMGQYWTPTWCTKEANLMVTPEEDGAISLVSQSSLFIHPQRTTTESVPFLTPAEVGGFIEVSAVVTDAEGFRLPSMQVSMTAGTDVTVWASEQADDDGVATFMLDTSRVFDSEAGFIPVEFSTCGPAFDFSAARLMVPVKNPRPEIVVTEPAEGETLTESDVTIKGYVYDSNGLASVRLIVDGTDMYDVPGDVGAAYWTFELVALDLWDGNHFVMVEAADSLGVEAELFRNFTVAPNLVTVVKYQGQPELSSVSLPFAPEMNSAWTGTLQVYGLKAMIVDVYDVTLGEPVTVSHTKLSLAKYPAGSTVALDTVVMYGGSEYLVVLTPLGTDGGYATLTWFLSSIFWSEPTADGLV